MFSLMTVNTSEIVKNGNNPKRDWISTGIFTLEYSAATKRIFLADVQGSPQYITKCKTQATK